MHKKVLITGGMSGLGKEIAFYAIKKGYKVDIIDISYGEIGESYDTSDIYFIHEDISKVSKKTIEQLSKKYDYVFCNAGISIAGKFTNFKKEQNGRLMEINCLGHIELIRLLLKNKKIGKGICFISSASEMLPFPVAPSYAATKGALRAFGESLRSALIGKKISVSIVYPGPMPTKHTEYYGKKHTANIKSQKKVQKIAKNIFNATRKKRRNIYPDRVSRILLLVSPFRGILEHIMYRVYKNEI